MELFRYSAKFLGLVIHKLMANGSAELKLSINSGSEKVEREITSMCFGFLNCFIHWFRLEKSTTVIFFTELINYSTYTKVYEHQNTFSNNEYKVLC